MHRLTSLPIIFLLSGCAGLGQVERIDDFSTEQLMLIQYAREIPLHELLNYEYISLGKVKGLSCAGDGQRLATHEEAVSQVRVKAVKAGGNAYTTPVCQAKNGTDWTNNCWSSVTCYSEAIKLIKTPLDAISDTPQKNDIHL